MPFKTRREKLAAGARRYRFVETQISLAPKQGFHTESKLEISQDSGDRTSHINIEKADNLSYVKNDLVKIVLTAAVIISVQIVLALTLA